MSDTCIFPDCNEPAHSMFWQGKTYCSNHYFKLMKDEFFTCFDQWVDGDPPDRLKYLLGRLYKEREYDDLPLIKGEKITESFLSSSQIHNYGFDFKKVEQGVMFSVRKNLAKKDFLQTWKLNIFDETAELIKQKQWKEGDNK